MAGVTLRAASVLFLAVLLNGCASSQAPTPATQPTPAVESRGSATSLRQQWLDMFARSYFPGRSGQVFMVPKEQWFVTSRDPLYRFMHGSPYDYDTHIPVLLPWRPVREGGSVCSAGDSTGHRPDDRQR